MCTALLKATFVEDNTDFYPQGKLQQDFMEGYLDRLDRSLDYGQRQTREYRQAPFRTHAFNNSMRSRLAFGAPVFPIFDSTHTPHTPLSIHIPPV